MNSDSFQIRAPDPVRRERLVYDYDSDDSELNYAIGQSLHLYDKEEKQKQKVEKLRIESDTIARELEEKNKLYNLEKQKLQTIQKENKFKMLKDILALLSRLKNYRKVYSILMDFVNSDHENYEIKEEDYQLFSDFTDELSKRKNGIKFNNKYILPL